MDKTDICDLLFQRELWILTTIILQRDTLNLAFKPHTHLCVLAPLKNPLELFRVVPRRFQIAFERANLFPEFVFVFAHRFQRRLQLRHFHSHVLVFVLERRADLSWKVRDGSRWRENAISCKTYLLPTLITRPITRGAQGGKTPLNFFRPPLEKCAEHSLKTLGPS